MSKSKRILFIAEGSSRSVKLFQNQAHKLAKGFTRLGNDVRIFDYGTELAAVSPFSSRRLSAILYKRKLDEMLFRLCTDYGPDIIHIGFPRCLDNKTIQGIRETTPGTIIIGTDGDPWPKLNPGRIETAKGFDILMATNDGQWIQEYRDAGVQFCVFMPNCCDPDIDFRYDVEEKWKSDILWIGTLEHNANTSGSFRRNLILKLAERDNCSLYGCCRSPRIGGLDSLYAISGARIGVSVNAYGDVRLAHSDRLTRFLAGGTMVLSKRFPDCELLYKDGVHLKYFGTIEEFFDIADWYLKNEQERKKIADAGMKLVHEEFNCVKIAGYMLDVIENGTYKAPWNLSVQ
jgi:hypothetical protein